MAKQINNAINPPQELTDYAHILMPARSAKIKKVMRMPGNGRGVAGMAGRNGEVYVSSDENSQGRLVRYHEAMHISHTPKNFKPKDSIDQSLEDARIHCHCSHASTSQFPQARRDELKMALKELRQIARHGYINYTASVATLRSCGILMQSSMKPAHAKLLKQACARLGANALADFSKAIALLAKWDGKQDSKAWRTARKIVAPYFVRTFDGKDEQPQVTSKPQGSKQESEDNQDTQEASVPDMPINAEDEDEESEDGKPTPSESEDEESDETEDGEDGKGNGEESEDGEDEESDGNGEASDGQAEDEDSIEDGKAKDAQAEDAKDRDGEGEESEDSGHGKSKVSDEDIAPVIEQRKPKKPRKLAETEYQGDLTPACDKENYQRMQAQYPLKLHIKRLDMQVNRVKLDMGRKAPLPVMSGGRIIARKLVPALTTPGTRVFARTINNGLGGSILIDNSGSMSIPETTLIEFLTKAPALTIGYYNAPNDMAKEGSIYIYAANGYRANFDTLPHDVQKTDGGGNVIDYQAMAWLIKQPAPHYFVCDKEFTANWAHAAHMLCDKLVASKQLIVVPCLEAMQAMMENGGKMPAMCLHNKVAKTCYYCERQRELDATRKAREAEYARRGRRR